MLTIKGLDDNKIEELKDYFRLWNEYIEYVNGSLGLNDIKISAGVPVSVSIRDADKIWLDLGGKLFDIEYSEYRELVLV